MSAYWVSPYLRDSVKSRLGLLRPAAEAMPPDAGAAAPDAPPQ